MALTKYERIAREQAARQAARTKRAVGSPKRRSRSRPYSWEDRIADRIDGYDRDNLGESPDY